MKLIIMGSGTSHGIPVVGCDCNVCTSTDEKDKRFRCSAYVVNEENDLTTNIVLDVGPEFRLQALKYNIKHLDAVFVSHSHADHCHGLDDLRVFSYKKSNANKFIKNRLPLFCNKYTRRDLIFRFSYIFKRKNFGGGIPNLELIKTEKFNLNNPVKVGSIDVIPIPITHGYLKDSGWVIRTTEKDNKIHAIAYLTDCNYISDKSIELIKDSCDILDHLVIDGLRKKEHVTHCNFMQALEYANKICAKHTWITHISHENKHMEAESYIKDNVNNFSELKKIVSLGGSVSVAYDGLVLET